MAPEEFNLLSPDFHPNFQELDENIMALIISYSSSREREWTIGALFRITGFFGAYTLVELVSVHPQHPFFELPVEKWVPGLSRSDAGLLLKPTMIQRSVNTEIEYFDLVASAKENKKRAKILARFANVLEQNLTKKLNLLKIIFVVL